MLIDSRRRRSTMPPLHSVSCAGGNKKQAGGRQDAHTCRSTKAREDHGHTPIYDTDLRHLCERPHPCRPGAG
jgi:hypothetical protein